MKTYDAGREREWLATTLAAYRAMGFIDARMARRWEHRLRMLARALRRPVGEVRRTIYTDATILDNAE
jgi:hypothetical protein